MKATGPQGGSTNIVGLHDKSAEEADTEPESKKPDRELQLARTEGSGSNYWAGSWYRAGGSGGIWRGEGKALLLHRLCVASSRALFCSSRSAEQGPPGVCSP